MQILSETPHAKPTPRRTDLEFHRLLAKLPAAAYTCNAQGLITYFNERAVELNLDVGVPTLASVLSLEAREVAGGRNAGIKVSVEPSTVNVEAIPLLLTAATRR